MQRIGRARSLVTPCVVLALLVVLGFVAAALAADTDEYQVKGAYLYNFAKFIEWPSQDMVGLEGEIRLCVLGSSHTAAVLSQVLEGRSAGKRRVSVRQVEDLTGASWCRIIFVTRTAELDAETVVNSLGLASILTVGESEGFASAGGMVNFTQDASKVRFEINEAAARRAGLKISSKLLRLATIVEE
jgi:hypothetical protein